MGELEDAAHDAALMECITSANIACGAHAGDDAIMERTARLAIERSVTGFHGVLPGDTRDVPFGPSALSLRPFGRLRLTT